MRIIAGSDAAPPLAATYAYERASCMDTERGRERERVRLIASSDSAPPSGRFAGLGSKSARSVPVAHADLVAFSNVCNEVASSLASTRLGICHAVVNCTLKLFSEIPTLHASSVFSMPSFSNKVPGQQDS